jgi:UDP-glucose 4-epimerase
MEMNKKVLIIGGAGFIGMNIARELVKITNLSVTICDNFFRGKMDHELSTLVKNNGIKVFEGDLTNPEAFHVLDNDYDQVYMLASVVGVEYTTKIPNELIRINTLLIINTLEWLKRSNCKKVLFTSTSECYAGSVEAYNFPVPTDESVPLCIQDITEPRFTYAVTKMLGESGFMNYAKIFGFDCTIVRYHNVYGPRMGFKHVIPQVVKRMLDNETPFRIYGSGQTRAFNYIDDAVSGTIAAMDRPEANNEIFHIGDMSAEISIEELVHTIADIIGFKGIFESHGIHDGSVSRRCPDTTKARVILGYKPNIHWIEGLKKTVEWYVKYYKNGNVIYE